MIDLERGPTERLESRHQRRKRHLEVAERLRQYRKRLVVDFERRAPGTEELPRDRALERLRALGYVE